MQRDEPPAGRLQRASNMRGEIVASQRVVENAWRSAMPVFVVSRDESPALRVDHALSSRDMQQIILAVAVAWVCA